MLSFSAEGIRVEDILRQEFRENGIEIGVTLRCFLEVFDWFPVRWS